MINNVLIFFQKTTKGLTLTTQKTVSKHHESHEHTKFTFNV